MSRWVQRQRRENERMRCLPEAIGPAEWTALFIAAWRIVSATRHFLWHTRMMMSDTVTPVGVRLGAQGRLVVPGPIRKALGLKTGDSLVIRVQDGRLIVESRELVVRRVQERFGVPGRNLVDELIAERRREARREEDD